MNNFEYAAPAEVYSTDGSIARKRPVSYRRFARSAEAIRYAVEQLPESMQRGTVMEVGGDRIKFTQIRALYDSGLYPLSRGENKQIDQRSRLAGRLRTSKRLPMRRRARQKDSDAELPERQSQL